MNLSCARHRLREDLATILPGLSISEGGEHVESRGLRTGKLLRGICVCVVMSTAALLAAVGPAQAKAASPVLEFVAPAAAFPIEFSAEGGEVTAVMDGFDTEVLCADSEGEGEITGSRSALSSYVFTGCEAKSGSNAGHECKSTGAGAGEIKAEEVEAELVYIDQAKHEVGMLLNPGEGVYIDFECGGEEVEGFGSFLSPVGPVNKEATSFTATLSQSNALQAPDEYENAIGEKRQAIPMGKRGVQPPATTGVELSFAIETSAPLEIKAITSAEIEAGQRQEEAAAAKKRQDEEAAAAAAAKKRQAEEAATAAAVRKRQEEEARANRFRRAWLLSKGLTRCGKIQSTPKRVRCEKRVKKKYGPRRGKL